MEFDLEPLSSFFEAIEDNGILKPYFFQSRSNQEQTRTLIENIARDLHSLSNRLDTDSVTPSDVSRLAESYRSLHLTQKAHGELLRLFAEAWLKNVTVEENTNILHSLVTILNDILFEYDDSGMAFVVGVREEDSWITEAKESDVGLLKRYEEAFENADPHGTGLMTLDDFKKSLNIVMNQVSRPERSDAEVEEIFEYFQKPGTNMIEYSLFLKYFSEHDAEEFQHTTTAHDYGEFSETRDPDSVNHSEMLMVNRTLQRWPTSRMLDPMVVEQYTAQEQELKQKEEELNLAHTVTSAMEQNISRLEMEKQGLVQEAHMLRYQLEDMYAESERQREKASMQNERVRKEVQSEKEQYTKYIKDREAELLRIVNLWTATRDALENERKTHSTHLNSYKKAMEAKSAKEKEVQELTEKLQKVEQSKLNKKEAMLELEKVKVTLAEQTEKRKQLEAMNMMLQEEVERLAQSQIDPHAHVEVDHSEGDVVIPITSFDNMAYSTSTKLNDLESEVKGRNLIRFRAFCQTEENERHNHSDRGTLQVQAILDSMIDMVCRHTPRLIYHHNIQPIESLGFIIWKDEMNNNAMVVKTNHDTAKQGVKVGSWICTINGQYVYGLPFEFILQFLRKELKTHMQERRPLRIGFMDDASTDSLNYIDNLETQNMLNNKEIKRLHSKYEHSSSVNEDVTPQARIKRMEKNENCIIQ